MKKESLNRIAAAFINHYAVSRLKSHYGNTYDSARRADRLPLRILREVSDYTELVDKARIKKVIELLSAVNIEPLGAIELFKVFENTYYFFYAFEPKYIRRNNEFWINNIGALNGENTGADEFMITADKYICYKREATAYATDARRTDFVYYYDYIPSYYVILDITANGLTQFKALALDSNLIEHHGKYYTPAAYKSIFKKCSICGEKAPIYERMQNITFCESCYEKTTVHDYSYKPNWQVFKKDNDNTKRFGIEIELQALSNFTLNSRVCTGLVSPYFFAKYDSSTGNNGFELVSHILTVDFFRRHKLAYQIEKLSKYARGYAARNYCGIHIHISRNYISGKALKNLVTFFKDNQQFITNIADRPPNDYNRAICDESAANEILNERAGRYYVINTQNEHTIEFRCFASNLSAAGVNKYVQFLDSLIDFADENTTDKMTAKNYVKYLNKRRDVTDLKEFINDFITFEKDKIYK